MQLIILSPDLLLVSVVVAEAADVVGGDVMDCAQHVLSILDLEITNQMPVSRSRDPALTNQRTVISFFFLFLFLPRVRHWQCSPAGQSRQSPPEAGDSF